MKSALVIGLGFAGESTARQVAKRGIEVVVTEDRPTDEKRAEARRIGVELVEVPDEQRVAELVASVDAVLPSPAVPLAHPAIQTALAAGVPVWTEFELAAQWDDRPCVAVTGTNGKTTVTTLVELMVKAAGRSTVAAGNNDLPLLDALDQDVECFVLEASSFRLEFTDTFRPEVGTWLNFAPDHLDWHPDLDHYAASKAKIWSHQRPDDVAIGNAADEVVMKHLRGAPSRQVTVGGDYGVVDGVLRTPDNRVIAAAADLPRNLPHDIANALAAAATVLEWMPDAIEPVRAVLHEFRGLPHRMALISDARGVRWIDDSKATTPASVVAGVGGLESAVLIAGGRNKGLDLSELATLAGRVHRVVAIGEAAEDIEHAFDGTGVPVERASSMDDAVAVAARHARTGDAVVLSPACASFDWYRNYAERGDDFARAVRELTGGRV